MAQGESDVTVSPEAITSPFEDETPRRDAMRVLGSAGAALLGMAGLSATALARGDNRTGTEARRRRKRRKRRPCNCPAPSQINLTFALSDPFSVAAGAGVTREATCPAGFLALSGGVEGIAGELTSECMIRESHTDADGDAWIVNVFCTQATNVDLVVGALCFGKSSFHVQ
jgi:hypothetical protein